jgi:hypothetical protein
MIHALELNVWPRDAIGANLSVCMMYLYRIWSAHALENLVMPSKCLQNCRVFFDLSSIQQSPLVLLTSSGTLLGSLLSLHRRRWSTLQIVGTHWLLPAFAKVADAICVLLEALQWT